MSGADGASLHVRLRQSTPIPLDVSLDCEQGELLALTGPSGSGKTTILRSIAGLQSVLHSEVICQGKTWSNTQAGIHLSPQSRRAGLVFQHYALFPHLSALENLTAAMTHRPRGERVERGMELLSLTNMEGLESRKPGELSGGQRQRIAVARALARDPAVLLLDEPFSAVDQLTRRRLYRELAQLRKQLQLPMVLVTHDMSEVQQLADRLCLIHRGTTLQSGTVSDVLQHPINANAARLTGHQNLFAGVIAHSAQANHVSIMGTTMECDTSGWQPGERVDVLITPAAVVMHRRDRPSRGERENPLTGTVGEAVLLGDELLVRLTVDSPRETLNFRLSRHVAARNQVAVGQEVTVSILSEGIHLMKTAQ